MRFSRDLAEPDVLPARARETRFRFHVNVA